MHGRAPMRFVIVVAGMLVALAGCDAVAPTAPPATSTDSGSALALWPRPVDTAAAVGTAGLRLLVKEHLGIHRHSHLDVFVDGKLIEVPAGIGINIDDPEVKPFDLPDGSISYGGINQCGQPCISPLHTHAHDGILHTESDTEGTRTLGELFDEWGVTLSSTCVGEYCTKDKPITVYIDGTAYPRDPREIALEDLREIAIVIGTPPPVVPKTADFSRA